jgi:hypothetical protein
MITDGCILVAATGAHKLYAWSCLSRRSIVPKIPNQHLAIPAITTPKLPSRTVVLAPTEPAQKKHI